MTDEQKEGALNDTGDRSVAAQEALVRAKVIAGREAGTGKNDTLPGTPEVSKLRSRRQGRLVPVMGVALVILLLMAWGGDRAYRYFIKSAPEVAAAASLSSHTVPAPRRSGMGSELSPFITEAPLTEETTLPGTSAGADSYAEQRATPTFNKALALVTDHAAPAPARGAVLSRVSERAVSTGEVPPAPAAVKGAVTRISFNPDLYIPENTYIPCTLQTRLVSDVAGRISCNIAEDIYSASGHTLLIEKGTKAKGVYKTGTLKAGQSRMFIIWTELRTPDAKKIALTDTQGVGQLGEAGTDGWIDTHFWERFGHALLLSTVQDVAAAAARSSPGTDRNTDYTENTRAATAEMAKTVLENSIGIPPTLYKNQGDIIGMLTGEDIDFSAVYTLKMKQG